MIFFYFCRLFFLSFLFVCCLMCLSVSMCYLYILYRRVCLSYRYPVWSVIRLDTAVCLGSTAIAHKNICANVIASTIAIKTNGALLATPKWKRWRKKTTITTIRNGNGYGQGGVIKQSHELYGLICQTLTLYVLSTQQHHQQPREISFDAVLRDVTHWTLVFLAERETFESSARTHCMAWMNE